MSEENQNNSGREIIDTKIVEIGNRKVELRLIRCKVNQMDFYGDRIYAKFIDNKKPPIKIEYNKKEKELSVGNKILS